MVASLVIFLTPKRLVRWRLTQQTTAAVHGEEAATGLTVLCEAQKGTIEQAGDPKGLRGEFRGK